MAMAANGPFINRELVETATRETPADFSFYTTLTNSKGSLGFRGLFTERQEKHPIQISMRVNLHRSGLGVIYE